MQMLFAKAEYQFSRSYITKRKTCCDTKVSYLYLFYDKAIVPQSYDRRLNDN